MYECMAVAACAVICLRIQTIMFMCVSVFRFVLALQFYLTLTHPSAFIYHIVCDKGSIFNKVASEFYIIFWWNKSMKIARAMFFSFFLSSSVIHRTNIYNFFPHTHKRTRALVIIEINVKINISYEFAAHITCTFEFFYLFLSFVNTNGSDFHM